MRWSSRSTASGTGCGARSTSTVRCSTLLVQSRRDKHAAKRLMRKLIKKHGHATRVLVTDNLRSYAAANKDLCIRVEHRQHKGLNNRAENSHQPTRVRKKVMRRFKSARHLQRFASTHDQVANLFMHCRSTRLRKSSETRAPGLRGLGKGNLRADDGRPGCVTSRSGSPRKSLVLRQTS